MRDESRKAMDRREFLKAGLTAAAALPVAATVLGARTAWAEEKLVTEVESAKMTVEALKYVNESTEEGKNCENCQFFTAQGDAGLGKCTLIPGGLVKATGNCASWTAKVT